MEALYMDDMTLRSFDATVVSVDGRYVTLDRTAFYPRSGGVAHDTGVLIRESDNERFTVTFVAKTNGTISHEVDREGLLIGDRVHAELDWVRRYALMRAHTSAHLLAALFHDRGVKITGNEIDTDKCRMDFNLPEFDRALIDTIIEEANERIRTGAAVHTSYLPREEALRSDHLVKLANALPPNIGTLRIVAIEGIDEQADGGCHVGNISEIGPITFVKADNKGKGNRRVYWSLR
jgi:misacylated tRNA(Ala) deacylase